MDGYLAGASYYNEENGTDVQVEGWDGTDGLFTGNFESQDDGRNVTDSLLQAGADIIMPVAGPVGLGTATAIEDFGSGMMIWVDTDGYESTQYGSLMLTSVMKNMDVAVFDTMSRPPSTTPSRAASTSARSRTRASAWRRSTTSRVRSPGGPGPRSTS
jgi:basic membrane protein A and related proteins